MHKYTRLNNSQSSDELPNEETKTSLKVKCSNLSKKFKEMNWNVRLVFIYIFFFYLASSIWGGSTLSILIFKISNNSSKLLGFTSGLEGILTLAAIFPSGYIADKFKTRDKLLKFACALGIIAVSLYFVAILKSNIPTIFLAAAFWGLFIGVSNPSLETIFADSVSTGNRSKTFAYKHFLLQFGFSIGPLITVFLFLFFGNNWSTSQLQGVNCIGLALTFISIGILIFFDDKKRLQDEIEEVPLSPKDKILKETDNKQSEERKGWFSLTEEWVPRIIAYTDLITAIGAGMTIKFFPVFLVDQYHLNPIVVNSIFALSPLITGIISVVAQRLSLRFGRPQMIFVVKSLGTFLLYMIALLPPVWILIPIFILRGSLMNSSEPLSRSILMDMVTKNTRGKWNALEGINRMAWTGSAVLGGFLIDSFSYKICFIITAGIYTIATLPLLLIWPLVKLENQEKKANQVELESLLVNTIDQEELEEKGQELQQQHKGVQTNHQDHQTQFTYFHEQEEEHPEPQKIQIDKPKYDGSN